jgi:hypothetical protein
MFKVLVAIAAAVYICRNAIWPLFESLDDWLIERDFRPAKPSKAARKMDKLREKLGY